jgi:orotidine-5'-phosphate decarboxylase
VSSFGSRLQSCFQSFGQLCVGIDPSAKQLKVWDLPDSAQGAESFAKQILDAADGQIGVIKPQVAFFEQYGAAGFKVLSNFLVEARNRGMIIIADAKRGDIGSTMDGYSRAWLGSEAAFVCDALTVSPYLGPASLDQTVETALSNNLGVFILAATSNPEAAHVQAAKSGAESVASSVAQYANSFAGSSLGSIGIVVGATVARDEVGLKLEQFPQVPILAPGFGAQGVELAKAGSLFGSSSANTICSVSRSVAGSSAVGLADRVQQAKSELAVGFGL